MQKKNRENVIPTTKNSLDSSMIILNYFASYTKEKNVSIPYFDTLFSFIRKESNTTDSNRIHTLMVNSSTLI